ncbi:MAG: hypothetical protein WA966_10470 [Ornithinimicrobium sp.]
MSNEDVDADPAGRCVIGVVGASGGLGATTLCAALAMRTAMARGRSLLIDAHPRGGGIDIHLGLDTEVGLRWPDLVSVRGAVETAEVVAGLPSVEGCTVLSWDRRPGFALGADGVHLTRALTATSGICVIDLPGPEADQHERWWQLCDQVVMLCGGRVHQVAAAAVVAECLLAAVERDDHGGHRSQAEVTEASVCGVLREQQRGAADRDLVSTVLGLPFVGVMRPDATVGSALTRGEPVGVRSGPVASLADAILAETLPSARGAA